LRTRSTFVFLFSQLQRNPIVSPLRVPIARARTKRTPFRRCSAAASNAWISSTSNGSTSSSSTLGAFTISNGFSVMTLRFLASRNAARTVMCTWCTVYWL
jgi:hypothetical protein